MAQWGVVKMQKAVGSRGNPELERAKDALRRAHRVVFNAEVTDGRLAKGLVKVNGLNMQPAEVIAMAKKVGVWA